jgi:hypothetical protein
VNVNESLEPEPLVGSTVPVDRWLDDSLMHFHRAMGTIAPTKASIDGGRVRDSLKV